MSPQRRLFALAISVVVAAAALADTPASADTTGPVIAHVPVATAAYGQPIDILMTSTCTAPAACAGRLYYRTTAPAALTAIPGVINEGGFGVVSLFGVPVEGNAVNWTGQIPASAATTRGIDYYLEAEQNGTVTRFPGSTTASTVQATGSYLHIEVLAPPLIAHEPVPFGTADQPYNVLAQVSCFTGNCEARLHYRKTPATLDPNVGWNSTLMSGTPTPLTGGATVIAFTGQVPAGSVDTTGVDYYLHVTDGPTQAYSPGTPYQGYYAPRDGFRQPEAFHHVHVLEPPRLVHEHLAAAHYRQDIPVLVQTVCPVTRTCQGTLYYRTTPPGTLSTAAFSSRSMTVTRPVAGVEAVSIEGTIPAVAADTRGVDYYFSVTDGTTTSWWPGTSAVDGPGVWVNGTRVAYHHIRVLEPPHFVHAPTVIAEALTDLVIETELTCATEECSASLHYTSTPNTPNSTQTIPMRKETATPQTPPTRVEVFRASIPANQVTTRGLAYYMTATDGFTNTALPGTTYWGAYAPVDGSNPAPELARFIVRVVDPPHPIHVPTGVAYTGEPIPVTMVSNCATPSCPATLLWRVTGQTSWSSTGMTASAVLPAPVYGNDLLTYTATIPGGSVTAAGVEYRMDISDGYVAQSTPTFPVVVTDRPAPGATGTALAFVPPAAQGPVNSSVPLTAKATWADGTPYAGVVRWCATPLESTSTSCTSSGTTTSSAGNVAFTVQPTTASPQLRVTAYADTMVAGVQDPTEVPGAAVVVGVAPPTAPEPTTVTFVPPAAQVTQGSSVSLAFTALRRDGSPFVGTVRWTAGAPGAPANWNTTSTNGSGNGSVVATPTAATPVVQVLAFADHASAGQFGIQDPTEAPGAATVVGTPPPPGPPQATTVTFVPPVAQTAQDVAVAMPFTARRGDGTPFAGTVRWSAGPPGVPSFGNSTGTDSAGNGSITVVPTAANPVLDVVAYADHGSAGQFGTQDPTEVAGAAAAIGTPTPNTGGTALAFTPPVATTAQGSAVTLAFTARNLDGTPYNGTVRWGSGAPGSTPSFGNSTSASNGSGTVTVTPTAATPAVQVFAYADRSGAGFGSQDPTEATGAAAALGSPPPPSIPQATTVTFVPPLAQAAQGSSTTLAFTARRGDGTPFAGAVRWSAGAPGVPSFTNLATADSAGNGSVTVTPTASTPVVQVAAFADNAGAGSGVQDPGELLGAAAAVGVPPVGPPPTGTTVVFAPPVAQTPQGSSVTMPFTARNLDGSPFTGTVRWGYGTAGASLTYGSTTSSSSGSGSVTVTPTAAEPALQVVAYADRAGAGFGTQDATEATGAAAALGVPPVPPPPATPKATTVVFDPPVVQTALDVSVTVRFTARKDDGSPFTGTVRWGSGAAGSVPSFPSTAAVNSSGNGSMVVTPNASKPVLQVVAYADTTDESYGVQGPGELLGAAAVVGIPPVGAPPSGTTVAFTPPVAQTPQGAPVTLSFTAKDTDGSPFTGTVRWGSAPAGTVPAFPSTTTTDSSGNGSVTVTPTAATPALQVVAYADRSGAGFATQDTTEATGAAAAVGTPPVPPPPTVPQATTVTFVPPVAQTAQGSSTTLAFTARRGDGTPFAGAVRWGAGAPGLPTFTNLATADGAGNGSVTVTPTAATPVVQVTAYADNAGLGSGVQDPGELLGAAAAIGVPPVGSPPSGTTLAFTPPVAQTSQGSSVTLPFTAKRTDGSPFTGTVRWGSAPAGSVPVFPSTTTTDSSGNGSVTVTPTAATPTLQVVAYADRSGVGFGLQDTTEAAGAAAVVGTAVPTTPEATVLTFVPPVAQTAQGASVALAFTARKDDGSPFTGTVRWGSGAAGSLPSFGSTTTTNGSGNGSITVTPTATTPVVQVTAYADSSAGGIGGVQDPVELAGVGVAVGIPAIGSPPSGTTLAFVPPVAQTPQGSSVTLGFTALDTDGTPFTGTVRWGSASAGNLPLYPSTTSTDGSGNGSVTVTPTAANPALEVVAYADRSGAGFGVQDTTEATGAAAVVGTPPVPPPPAVPRATTIAFVPPAAQTPQGSSVTMGFTARRGDGSPFVGTVRWGRGAAGSLPSFGSTTSTNSSGNGSVTVTPTAGSPVLEVTAFADESGTGFGTQDAGEVIGAAVAVGTDVDTDVSPSGTAVAFVPPVTQALPGTPVTLPFTAKNHDGSPFVGTVRWGSGSAGSMPAFTSTTTTNSAGGGSITVVQGTSPALQVVAFADRFDGGFGEQEGTEAVGTAGVVGTQPVTPTVPWGTNVVFSAPVGRGTTGSNVTLPFTARNFDGSPFVGTVRWTADAAGSVPSYGSSVGTDAAGNGSLTVTPTAATPVLQVVAFADRANGSAGSQDNTEAAGVAVAVGDTAPPAPPPGTSVVFTTPVWTAQSGTHVGMAFTARRSDTTKFTGTVYYSIGAAGSTPSFTWTTTTDAYGDGWVPLDVGTAPVHIVAYADRAEVGSGGQMDATEVAGTTVVIGMNV